jgi:hypothetical protein
VSDDAATRTQAVEDLAAKLQLPPAGLPALRGLTAQEAGLLADLIAAARKRRRATVDAALERTIPIRPVRRAVLAVLRRPLR